MVGLEKFINHFKDFKDRFVLIGGAACSLLMDKNGLIFRSTKDIDIVLLIEKTEDSEFANAIHDFIESGKYKNYMANGEKKYYRFFHPESPEDYPSILEFFSNRPLGNDFPGRLTRIKIDDEMLSLSAIVLDDNYFNLIKENKLIVSGCPIVSPEILILLKSKAYLDLTKRKSDGEKIDSNKIKKHRNDIFRLYRLLTQDCTLTVPENIKYDMKKFLEMIKDKEDSINLKNLGIRNTNLNEIIINIKRIFKF